MRWTDRIAQLGFCLIVVALVVVLWLLAGSSSRVVAPMARSSSPYAVTVIVVIPTATRTPTRTPVPYRSPYPTKTALPTWEPGVPAGPLYQVPRYTPTVVVPLTVIPPTYPACAAVTPAMFYDQVCEVRPGLTLPAIWR